MNDTLKHDPTVTPGTGAAPDVDPETVEADDLQRLLDGSSTPGDSEARRQARIGELQDEVRQKTLALLNVRKHREEAGIRLAALGAWPSEEELDALLADHGEGLPRAEVPWDPRKLPPSLGAALRAVAPKYAAALDANMPRMKLEWRALGLGEGQFELYELRDAEAKLRALDPNAGWQEIAGADGLRQSLHWLVNEVQMPVMSVQQLTSMN